MAHDCAAHLERRAIVTVGAFEAHVKVLLQHRALALEQSTQLSGERRGLFDILCCIYFLKKSNIASHRMKIRTKHKLTLFFD